MNWLNRVVRRADQPAADEVKASRTGPLVALTGRRAASLDAEDYAALASQGFAKNPVVYRCVRMIAEAAASVSLTVFEDGMRADDHALARLLARPNPEQSGPEWLEELYGALQTAGNAYAEAVGDEGAAEELWSLRPDRVTIVPGRQGWPEAYEYTVDGRAVRIVRGADGWMPAMQLKLFHPTDDYYGLSPLEASAFAIDVHNGSSAWNMALLDNAARPSGALVYGGKDGARLSGEQFEALKAELAGHSGSVNAGRPLVLEGGLDWKQMSLSPAEMDFIAGKHAAAREIALAFGVPPQLLGIPGDATYANYREANAAFWRGTVVPLVRKTAGALTGWLGSRFGTADLKIEADLDSAPGLQGRAGCAVGAVEAASFLTDEERRRMAGVGA